MDTITITTALNDMRIQFSASLISGMHGGGVNRESERHKEE
jgi:hypothetical protein